MKKLRTLLLLEQKCMNIHLIYYHPQGSSRRVRVLNEHLKMVVKVLIKMVCLSLGIVGANGSRVSRFRILAWKKSFYERGLVKHIM